VKEVFTLMPDAVTHGVWAIYWLWDATYASLSFDLLNLGRTKCLPAYYGWGENIISMT